MPAAKPGVQPDPKAPEAAKPAAPATPSFNDVVREGQERRARERAGEGAEGTPLPGAEPNDQFDFESEWGKLDPRLRDGATQRFNDSVNQQLQSEYGDILDVVAESKKDANLREVLKLAGSDPELRGLLADSGTREFIKKLTKKELRDFLASDGVSAFEKYYPGDAPPAANAPDPRDQRIEALEQRMSSEADVRETQTYLANRNREAQALLTAFPDLAQNERQLQHVIEHAESKFRFEAQRRGINTDDSNAGWPAAALRAGVKPPSYHDSQSYLAEVYGRSAPPAAPATSPSTIAPPPQAPRSAAEGKQRALDALSRAGGFRAAASSPRRKR